MSIDPVTDEIRRWSNHPFASRPLGDIDEDGRPIKDVYELADTIRIAVEESQRRAKRATTPALREANLLVCEFWQDCARLGIHFGYPPRTNIVTARMYDWQMWRIWIGKQRRFNGMAQGELRDSLEKAWCSIMFEGESIGRLGHSSNIVIAGR